jgi:hypothetical protein
MTNIEDVAGDSLILIRRARSLFWNAPTPFGVLLIIV